jgi:hypothetical protein
LIDPARCWWGRRPATLLRRRMLHPRATADQLSPALQSWAADRLVPKVLVATQTRVLEAVADEAGILLPVVPVITAATPPERIWHLLAALTAPPVAALAHRMQTGAALSPDAIKLSARQVASLPLPSHRPAWDRGADLLRAASLSDGAAWRDGVVAAAAAMCDAYAVPAEAVMPWWMERFERLATRS